MFVVDIDTVLNIDKNHAVIDNGNIYKRARMHISPMNIKYEYKTHSLQFPYLVYLCTRFCYVRAYILLIYKLYYIKDENRINCTDKLKNIYVYSL